MCREISMLFIFLGSGPEQPAHLGVSIAERDRVWLPCRWKKFPRLLPQHVVTLFVHVVRVTPIPTSP